MQKGKYQRLAEQRALEAWSRGRMGGLGVILTPAQERELARTGRLVICSSKDEVK